VLLEGRKVLGGFGRLVGRLGIFDPLEERSSSFIELEGLVVLSLVEPLVALLPELLVGHEARAALKGPHLAVVLSVEEKRVLQVDGVFIKELPADGGLGESSPDSREVKFRCRQVKAELRDKGLIEALLF